MVDWSNPDEVKAYKAEKQRGYDRKNREDPAWLEKYNKRKREWLVKRRAEDPEFRKRNNKITNIGHKRASINKKLKAIEYTGGLRCHNPNCGWEGELQLCQVDFHHQIAENKTRGFGQMFSNHKWETIQAEIDNCNAIPLCSNCHMLEEHNTDDERRSILVG